MTAALGSFMGFAKQTAKGTPNVTDASFQYLLFTQGVIAPQNVVVPLDTEIGGGALLRDVKKVGVTSGGAVEFIPRPATLGTILMGILGKDSIGVVADTTYTHTFTLPTDQFSTPYYTLRSAPGNMWGEQFQDCRFSGLSLQWKAAGFLRGQLGIVGGLPGKVATTTWTPMTYLDGGPQFLTPIATVELPTATPVKCLSGSFSAGVSIPLDEQWMVGSYSPDAMDITARQFSINLVLKIIDATLYSKVMYDPAGGSAWLAGLMREGNFSLKFLSDILAGVTTPYSLDIDGNGSTGALANVIWSAAPIGLRAGGQVIMSLTGIFVADPNIAAIPISIALCNKAAVAY
jgi:hypothetical protein